MILDEWNLEFESESPTFVLCAVILESDDVLWFTFTVKDAFCVKDLLSRRGRVIFIGILRAVNYEPP